MDKSVKKSIFHHQTFQGWVVLFLIFLASCKAMEPPHMPTIKPVPEVFLMESDTSGLADISWREFFNDPFLVNLIETGLQNNLDLLAALERIEIARANYKVRKGVIYPNLDAIVRYRSGDIRPNLFNGTVNGDRNVINRIENNFVGFQSTWEIDIWGKMGDRRDAAFNQLLATEKGQQLIVTNLVAEIAGIYYDLLGFDIELETIEKNIEFQEMALELIKIQKMVGRATELAVQQFSAQLLNTRSMEFEKRQDIIEAENYLNYLLGRYPQPIERAPSLMQIRLPYIAEVGLPSEMLLRRPDIQMAEYELRAAAFNVEAARKEFLPSFSLTPYIGLNDRSIPAAFQFPGAISVGLLGGITAPIFAQNQIRAGYQEAIASNRIAIYQYQESILTGYREVMDKLQRIQNLRDVYALRNEETAVLLNAVTTANELFRGGYASYLEVITAQSRVLEAELGMTDTRRQMFFTVVDLYRALGGGWE